MLLSFHVYSEKQKERIQELLKEIKKIYILQDKEARTSEILLEALEKYRDYLKSQLQ